MQRRGHILVQPISANDEDKREGWLAVRVACWRASRHGIGFEVRGGMCFEPVHVQ